MEVFSKDKVKGLITGVCVTALLMTAITAFAVGIDVEMGGIKVYWDGVMKTLTNAKGEAVEPMIYEGTTYVPLRAMANLMGKEVDWDQTTFSVYVGGKPVGESTAMDKLDRSKINRETVEMRTNAGFQLKDKVIQCSNLLNGDYRTASNYKFYSDIYNIYVLDNQYGRLAGKAVMPYRQVGEAGQRALVFYSVANDGTEHEIATYELKKTDEAIDIDVRLTGVTNLKILWRCEQTLGDTKDSIAFYDINLIGR